MFSELLDTDDLEIKKEIDELVHEEEDMLKVKNEEEEDELDASDEKGANNVASRKAPPQDAANKKASSSSDMVIELSDDDEDNNDKPTTIGQVRNLYKESGILAKLKIDPQIRFDKPRVYTLQYPGPTFGLIMVSCNGRVVVKSHNSANATDTTMPKIGSIIVGCNGYLIP